jgi:sugar lactone lactonase YvrE
MTRAAHLPAALLFSLVLVTLPAEREPVITTVAGTGKSELGPFAGKGSEVSIKEPFGVEVGPGRRLYICEVGHHRVLALDPRSGRVETVAGNGKKGHEGDGGPALEASLNEPYEVRFDGAGNMYFVEMAGAVVRKVDPKGVISTIAGTGEAGFEGDGGPARKARFSTPHSIALDLHGLYVADIGNHRIRRIDLSSGVIETIAGNGQRRLPAEGTPATGQPILGPRALFVRGGTLWIALREGNSVWKMDLKSRRLSRVAGSDKPGYRDGPALEAAFNEPKGIVMGPRGDLFVADTENQAIRRIDLQAGLVTTVAGSGPEARGYGGDGGPARKARLDRPHGVGIDEEGRLYIGDTGNHRVRLVEP